MGEIFVSLFSNELETDLLISDTKLMIKTPPLVILVNATISNKRPSLPDVSHYLHNLKDAILGAGYEVILDETASRLAWRLNDIEKKYPQRLVIIEVNERDYLNQTAIVRFLDKPKEVWPAGASELLIRLESHQNDASSRAI